MRNFELRNALLLRVVRKPFVPHPDALQHQPEKTIAYYVVLPSFRKVFLSSIWVRVIGKKHGNLFIDGKDRFLHLINEIVVENFHRVFYEFYCEQHC